MSDHPTEPLVPHRDEDPAHPNDVPAHLTQSGSTPQSDVSPDPVYQNGPGAGSARQVPTLPPQRNESSGDGTNQPGIDRSGGTSDTFYSTAQQLGAESAE